MDKKLTQRKKNQAHSLLEPYTVMLDGRPVVVRARSVDEALKLAAKTEVSETNGKREEGDDSSIR